MLIDSRRARSGDRLETDICIIGAGPAGVGIAREWVDMPYRVALLESGPLDYDTRVQSLSRGSVDSSNHSADALSAGRRRQFGGTSNLWVYKSEPDDGRRYARCLPPEPIDFETLDFRGGAGWPFPLSGMQPYYERAQRLWNGGAFDYDVARWADDRTPPLRFRNGGLTTRMCQHGPGDVFRQRYRDELLAADNVTVHPACTALGLEWQSAGSTIKQARVARADGSTFAITARVFVLATGGVENVQLLLLSEPTRPGGPANRHDNIGRFVTDHPEFRMGAITPGDGALIAGLGLYDLRWRDGFLVSGFLTLGEQVKRDEKLLNLSAALVAQPPAFGSRAHRCLLSLLALRRGELPEELLSHLTALLMAPRQTAAVLRMRRHRYREFSGGWSGPGVDPGAFGKIELHVASEQTSERENRIVLGSARDALGRQQPNLHWRWSESDHRNIERSLGMLRAEIEGAGLGAVERWVEFKGSGRPLLTGLHHPMGGTRMHPDPRQGVVDENCLVHGTSNLYVAGSSVFPNGHGYANPTLTLLALAMRLSDHVKRLVV